jgi:hypothetical protein
MRVMVMRVLAAVVGATFLWVVWLANVGPLDECTAVGCMSMLSIETGVGLGEGTTYEIEVCLDDECWEGVPVANDSHGDDHGDVYVDAGGIVQVFFGEEERSRTGRVSVVLTAAGEEIVRHEEEVEFEVSQPNGPWCEPTCYFGLVTV